MSEEEHLELTETGPDHLAGKRCIHDGTVQEVGHLTGCTGLHADDGLWIGYGCLKQ